MAIKTHGQESIWAQPKYKLMYCKCTSISQNQTVKKIPWKSKMFEQTTNLATKRRKIYYNIYLKLDRQWMGCISEWSAIVNGNVCVSGMHNYAFNRFDAC